MSVTTRESEVLRLVARGLTNPQISERPSISTSRVNHHVHNLLCKLGAKTRTEAVSIAVCEGAWLTTNHGGVAALWHRWRCGPACAKREQTRSTASVTAHVRPLSTGVHSGVMSADSGQTEAEGRAGNHALVSEFEPFDRGDSVDGLIERRDEIADDLQAGVVVRLRTTSSTPATSRRS